MNLTSLWLDGLKRKTQRFAFRRNGSLRRQRPTMSVEALEGKLLLVGDIAGTLLHDANGNAVKDMDENGLAGWTVYLDINQNGSLEVGEPSTLTNVDGDYLITDLEDGDYTVREVLQPGWTTSPGTEAFQTATIFDGNEFKANFFNMIAAVGSISGTVWNDFNGDGLRALSDSGLVGWTVFIDSNNDTVANPGELTTTTDANGDYVFAVVASGEHKVREVLPAGWTTSPGYDTNKSVIVTTGGETVLDFANFTPEAGSVSGTVWDDVDGNHVRATNPTTGAYTEPGLAGWQVFVDQNGDGLVTLGEPTATTDANGDYTLFGVPYGLNTIREVTNPDFLPTAPTTASYTINLLNGQSLDGYDFGNHERREASISGTIYADSDHDGVRDAGERGLAGITIYLDLDNDDLLDATEPRIVTSDDLYYTPSVDEAGSYSFTHLAKGTYSVREILPDDQGPTPATEVEHTITVGGAEDKSGVNCGNVYRPNEIHGVKFEDLDGDHIRDVGEPGLGGVTIYIDLDRDNVLDATEPTTTTAIDGAYAFTNLTPGAYVVREIVQAGYEQTYPTTVDGILWPSGISNSAVGNVTPTSITTSLAAGETHRQTVSLTLPNTGALTNLVDVFLLFDDTGSFTGNSPIVRAAFPEIIAALQASLPGIDLGFGVGRLEEYANFAAEYATGRPFILNQPIVASSTTGFSAAIQAALDRTAPGYGGDQPETDIEALYQLVTGAGFDGNNNGSVLDSGAAGLVSTQLNPGSSGDVPSFASFTADASGNVLAAAGNLGGGGFRAGALPIILTATDTGFAYQPKGETSITGLGDLTLPISEFTQTSRPTTPFNSGAGIQETITGLNALGALVIGLGTNGDANIDPRQGLEALAKLTGATNQSTATIANGTADPIAPGDPFYFQIASGFSASVANGVTTAIQNAVTNVAVNITLRASDPRVQIINHTGTLNNLKAGDTATFDVEFVGKGIPRRFDLQFVRAGTNVVLGSIPVVLGTPVPGDGYSFEELDDGEIELACDFGNVVSTVAPPNVAPSFVAGANQSVLEDAGAQSVTWASSISAGTASESGQLVDFIVSNNNASLFSVAPAIAADGTLTYTPAANAHGSATITVSLHDNGGIANSGVDTSATQTFTITITPVNDAGTFGGDTSGSGVEDSGSMSGTLTFADVADGASTPNFTVTTLASNGTASIDASTGAWSYSPNLNFHGSDSFTVSVTDDDGNIETKLVSLVISQLNDAGTFGGNTSGSGVENSGNITGTLTFTDSADGASVPNFTVTTLASNGTASINSSTGAWSYSPNLNFNGSDSFTVSVTDDDGNIETKLISLTVTPIATRDLVYTATGTTVLTVTVVSGKLQVKIGSVVQPAVDPMTVRSMLFNGGSGRDSVNLTGLSTVLYSHVIGTTINGGDGNDILIGGPFANTINGGNGNNVITGGAGNDTLSSGTGSDTISGLAGNDQINAGLGTDSVLGGDGNDDIHGGAGKDTLDGGTGNDCLHGDADNDKLFGGAGNDTLRGGLGDDALDGGTDNDVLLGEDGNDTVLGGLGADILLGGIGADSLNGNGSTVTAGDGDDTLLGGAGRDNLKGGTGNDILSGDEDNDTLAGEGGTDSLYGGLGTDSLLTGESNNQDGVFNDAAFQINLELLLAACP